MTLVGFLAAFGGGVFGAALGALPVFILFVGLMVVVAAGIQLATGNADFFAIPFGPFAGPHVGGFAAGVAALAYATSKGKFDNGRNITAGMMGLNSPDVLLVGGVFGVVGYVIQWAFSLIPAFGPGYAWTDTVALTVVVSAIIVRLVFGKTGVFGTVKPGESRYAAGSGSPWVPWQSEPLQLLVIGLGAGLSGGYLGATFGAPGVMLSFGLAAFSLAALQFGVQIPVTHHIALPAAIAAAASGSIIWGGIFGIVCAFVGEFMARTFVVHGDTHIDPPAATIAVMTTVANALAAFGVLSLLKLP